MTAENTKIRASVGNGAKVTRAGSRTERRRPCSETAMWRQLDVFCRDREHLRRQRTSKV